MLPSKSANEKILTFALDASTSKNEIKRFDPKILAFVLLKMVNNSKRKSDIMLMIAAYIERGNKVSKMNQHSLPKFSNVIKELIVLYDLVDKPGSNPMAVTLSRVAELFPHLACNYSMSFAKNNMVPYNEMNNVCEGYPKFMMCQAFTALIPNDETYTITLLKAHALYLYYFTVKISNKNIPTEKMIQDTWKYMIIVHQRSYWEDSKKKDILKKVNVLGINGLQDSVINAAQIFDKIYQKYLENEPELDLSLFSFI